MRVFHLCLLVFFAGLVPAFAQSRASRPIQRYAESLGTKGPLQGASIGLLVVDRKGDTLARLQPHTRLVPASNLKLVTTGCALHAFGPEYRLRTGIGYTGRIEEDGTLKGDLWILGGGDPTIGAKDSMALRPDALFWKWKSLARAAGIRRIDGRIVGDGRAWEGHLENPSWSYDDTGTYYGAGSEALSFYQNATDWSVRAGAAPGDTVKARQTYPDTPWMHSRNLGITGPAGSGNSLYLFTTDLAPYAELRGTFAVDRDPKTEHFANKYGALTCAYYFWKNLKDTGWEVSGTYADVDRCGYIREEGSLPVEKAGTPVMVGWSESPTLREIVRQTNVRSDNFYAESLFRAMGEAASGVAVYDSCRVAEQEVLLGLGLALDGICIEDGSGLSRQNHVSPAFLVSFLQRMAESPAFEAFVASLPHPGEGTLASLLPNLLQRERLCFKSGSMGGTLCYSGYVMGDDGKPEITFSILTNNAKGKQADVRAALARLLTLLVK